MKSQIKTLKLAVILASSLLAITSTTAFAAQEKADFIYVNADADGKLIGVNGLGVNAYLPATEAVSEVFEKLAKITADQKNGSVKEFNCFIKASSVQEHISMIYSIRDCR